MSASRRCPYGCCAVRVPWRIGAVASVVAHGWLHEWLRPALSDGRLVNLVPSRASVCPEVSASEGSG